jgi:FIMAH domain
MFGCRLIRTMATAAFVTGVLTAGEVRAQATLGFTIDPTQGAPGTIVNGQVDVADIAANCNTTIEQLQAAFAPIFETMGNDFSFISLYFPECMTDPSCSAFKATYTYEQEAYVALAFAALGIANNLDVGTGPAAEVALPQTFVLTFADIVTQQPVGERSTFDPTTGEGSVTVPNIAPGPWAVAAACVEPSIDLVPAAITAGAALFESLGVPLTFPDENAFANSLLDPTSDIFLGNLATTLLVPMMAPKALGVQLFTVLAPPPQAIEDVIEDVRDLVAAGDLKKGQGKALTKMLRNALRSVNRGKTEAACGQLGAFQNAASAMGGTSTDDVIAQVETIRGQLGCEQPGSPSGAFVNGGAMP